MKPSELKLGDKIKFSPKYIYEIVKIHGEDKFDLKIIKPTTGSILHEIKVVNFKKLRNYETMKLRELPDGRRFKLKGNPTAIFIKTYTADNLQFINCTRIDNQPSTRSGMMMPHTGIESPYKRIDKDAEIIPF